MHLGNKKCLSGLWIAAAALQQRPQSVETGVCFLQQPGVPLPNLKTCHFQNFPQTRRGMMQARLEGKDVSA